MKFPQFIFLALFLYGVNFSALYAANKPLVAQTESRLEDKEILLSAPVESTEQPTIDDSAIRNVSLDENFQEPIAPASALETDISPLKSALEKAYNSNPQLKSERRAFQAIVEQVPQALSGALPTVSAGYSRGRERNDFAGTGWNYLNSEAKTLNVTQPLFRGGSTYAETKSARRQVDAGLARLTQAEQATLLQAVSAYMDVVRSNAILELSIKNRDVLIRQSQAATQRFEVGEDTRTDVAQSDSRLALAKSEVINSQGLLATAKAVYEEIIGEMPASLNAPDSLPALPATLEALTDNALKYNPLIIEAENLKDSADYVVDANKGTLLPQIDLQANALRQEGVGFLGTAGFEQDQIVIAATLPLYAGGERYSRVRQAKQNFQQRRYQLTDARLQVRRQAVSAWEDYQTALAIIDSNQTAIDSAEIALEGVRQEQQYGSRTTLDVLDAEREFFNAQVQLVVAQRNKVVAAYNILAVMGNLTAKDLGLDVPIYDAVGYYNDTEYQFIGF